MRPWNDWYHVTGGTYGTWLRGDGRGWRARRHREHVEGDYKDPPPPGAYDELHERSRRLMKRSPILLDEAARRSACDEIAASLLRHDIHVLVVGVDDRHYHVLAKFPAHNPRKFIGIAKKDAARVLSDRGLAAKGGVWGKRCRCLPITDRSHQLNAFLYIADHVKKGAAVWTFKTPKGS